MKTSILLYCLVLFLFFSQKIYAQEKKLNDAQKSEIEQSLKKANDAMSAGNKNEALKYYGQVASVYIEAGVVSSAVDYYTKGINIANETNNQNAAKLLNFQMGRAFSDNGKYQTAVDYFNEALKISKKLKDKTGIYNSTNSIAGCFVKMGKASESLKYFDEASKIAMELNDEIMIANCFGDMAKAYKALGNSEKADEYASLASSLKEKYKLKHIQNLENMVTSTENSLHKKQSELTEKMDTLNRVMNENDSLSSVAQFKQLQIQVLNSEKKLNELALSEKDAKLKTNRIIVYCPRYELKLRTFSAFFSSSKNISCVCFYTKVKIE